MEGSVRPQSRDEFEIAIICALTVERNAVEALLDEEYETDDFKYGKAEGDPNAYTTGRLGMQNVVLAYMPGMGTTSAAAVAVSLRSSFRGVRVAIVVGICGGVPTTPIGVEILLGDVIISTSVVQIDFGRQYPNKFIRKKAVEDILGRANPEVQALVGKAAGYLAQRRLRDKTFRFAAEISAKAGFAESLYPGPTNDILYPADYRHKHRVQASCICGDCKGQNDDVCESARQGACEDIGCDRTRSLSMKRRRIQAAMGAALDESPSTPTATLKAQKPSIHFGRIACGNQVMKSGQHRDRIAGEEQVIGFDMESAGTWDYVPTIVVKSVCDYADSHKNKQWQAYAAATAAACTKAFLEEWRTVDRPTSDRSEKSPRPSSSTPTRRRPELIERDNFDDIKDPFITEETPVGTSFQIELDAGAVAETQVSFSTGEIINSATNRCQGLTCAQRRNGSSLNSHKHAMYICEDCKGATYCKSCALKNVANSQDYHQVHHRLRCWRPVRRFQMSSNIVELDPDAITVSQADLLKAILEKNRLGKKRLRRSVIRLFLPAPKLDPTIHNCTKLQLHFCFDYLPAKITDIWTIDKTLKWAADKAGVASILVRRIPLLTTVWDLFHPANEYSEHWRQDVKAKEENQPHMIDIRVPPAASPPEHDSAIEVVIHYVQENTFFLPNGEIRAAYNFKPRFDHAIMSTKDKAVQFGSHGEVLHVESAEQNRDSGWEVIDDDHWDFDAKDHQAVGKKIVTLRDLINNVRWFVGKDPILLDDDET